VVWELFDGDVYVGHVDHRYLGDKPWAAICGIELPGNDRDEGYEIGRFGTREEAEQAVAERVAQYEAATKAERERRTAPRAL
jgi:hypothetical protein